MNTNDNETVNEASFKVREKIGEALLSYEDVVVLTCAEIAKTFSRDEKGYA